MINLTAELETVLGAEVVTPVALIEFTIGNNDVRRWTDSPWPVTRSGSSYEPDNPVLSGATKKERGALERDLFELRLVDSEPAAGIRNAIGADLTKVKVRAWTRFLFEDNGVERLTADELDVFSGFGATLVSEYEANDGLLAKVAFTGPLSKRAGSRPVLTTVVDQANRDKKDTAYEFAHQALDLKWGRK